MSSEPIRLLEGPDASDVERSLLRLGRSTAPVEYDVAAGAARFRTQLAALAAAGAVTAGVGASGSGVALRGKALLTKLAFKVVLGLMAGGVFAGAGVVAGMHMARTSGQGSVAPAPPKAQAPVVAPPSVRVPSSIEGGRRRRLPFRSQRHPRSRPRPVRRARGTRPPDVRP